MRLCTQVRGGLKAIYCSGWQVAGDANTAGDVYPDQSLYPANAVPELVRKLNKVRGASMLQVFLLPQNPQQIQPSSWLALELWCSSLHKWPAGIASNQQHTSLC